jgi:hypothetical protein
MMAQVSGVDIQVNDLPVDDRILDRLDAPCLRGAGHRIDVLSDKGR